MKRASIAFLAGVVVGSALTSILLLTLRQPALSDDGSVGVRADAGFVANSPNGAARPGGVGTSAAVARPGEADVVDSIEDLAREDPLAALDELLAMNDDLARRRRADLAAAVWASDDPRPVLDRLATVGDSRARNELMSSVLYRWSMRDTAGTLEYLIELEGTNPDTFGPLASRLGYEIDADADLGELFELADVMAPILARDLRARTVQAMAQRDPELALDYLARMPNNEQMDLAPVVARYYAESDPSAALDWARQQRIPYIVEAVLGTMAVREPYRALELALELRTPTALGTVVSQAADSAATTPRELASALAALPESGSKQEALSLMVRMWARDDFAAAFEWLIGHGDLPPGLLEGIAPFVALTPDAAADYAHRIPAHDRGGFIEEVAAEYASSDAYAAARWIEQFRGEAGFDGGVAQIALRMASYDGARAAELYDSVQRSGDDGMAAQIASEWARFDPEAAARWMETFPESAVSRSALGDIARYWLRIDPLAAESWMLGLSSGVMRDGILSSALESSVAAGSDPERLLAAFSSDAARQQAVYALGRSMLRGSPAAARSLVERYVTDPELRRQFDEAAGE